MPRHIDSPDRDFCVDPGVAQGAAIFADAQGMDRTVRSAPMIDRRIARQDDPLEAEDVTSQAMDERTAVTSVSDWIPQEPVPDQWGRIVCPLLWCPEVPRETRFSFYRRRTDGSSEVLEEGVLQDGAPSLNLAHLRRRGAQLGAHDVVLILP